MKERSNVKAEECLALVALLTALAEQLAPQ